MSLSPTAKKNVRAQMVSYCLLAERNERMWHYTQNRPYSGLGVAPQSYHWDDCSAYVALVCYWAGRHAGHPIADPLGQHYSGWGNTETEYAFLHAHHAPENKYMVGDMAIYGGNLGTQHTVICRKNGTGATAIWSSNGSEAGPNALQLHYRPDLIGVFRHPALL